MSWRRLVLVFLLVAAPAHAASRIVSLKPNVTEILFSLGAGPQVVGVTTFCDRPPEAKALPKIADYIHANAEEILKLRPDLVVGSMENSSQKEVFFLMGRGIKVKLFPFSTIRETLASMRAIGVLLGRQDQAEAIAATMEKAFAALQTQANAVPKKKVLFVVGYQPLVVAGSGNFFDESSAYLGITNVAGESKLRYPTFTTELLIRSAPEVVIDLTMGTEKTKNHEAERRVWWRQFGSIPAVKSGQIHFFDIEKMRAAPTLPEAFNELFALIHGKI